MTRFLTAGCRIDPFFADLGATLLRVAVGLGLSLGHGLGKIPVSQQFIDGVGGMGFPMPVVFAWAAALSEVAGGFLLALGLFTRPAAFFVAFTMGVAFFVTHAADPFATKEMAFLYGTAALFFLLAGSGRISVDRLLRSSGGRRS